MANSYKYTALTDRYDAIRWQGRLVVEVFRTYANKAPYGHGQTSDTRMTAREISELFEHTMARQLTLVPTKPISNPEFAIEVDSMLEGRAS